MFDDEDFVETVCLDDQCDVSSLVCDNLEYGSFCCLDDNDIAYGDECEYCAYGKYDTDIMGEHL